jgi:hypothetical protein
MSASHHCHLRQHTKMKPSAWSNPLQIHAPLQTRSSTCAQSHSFAPATGSTVARACQKLRACEDGKASRKEHQDDLSAYTLFHIHTIHDSIGAAFWVIGPGSLYTIAFRLPWRPTRLHGKMGIRDLYRRSKWVHLGWVDHVGPFQMVEVLPLRLSLVLLGATASSPLQHHRVALHKCSAPSAHANNLSRLS